MEIKHTRVCRQCSTTITYTNKQHKLKAERKGSVCLSCTNKNKGKTEQFWQNARRGALKRKFTERQKQQARKQLAKVTNRRPVYEIWVEKFGTEEADRLDTIRKQKWSQSSSGENNPMYGKPSPAGSGNGWSGWYMKMFFRSLHELACMLWLQRQGIEFWSAEQKRYKITYKNFLGTNRNYFADFVTANKQLIECKPKRLWNSVAVSAKKKAAQQWCKRSGFKYKLIDLGKPDICVLRSLMEQGLLVFTDRYAKKFTEVYG